MSQYPNLKDRRRIRRYQRAIFSAVKDGLDRDNKPIEVDKLDSVPYNIFFDKSPKLSLEYMCRRYFTFLWKYPQYVLYVRDPEGYTAAIYWSKTSSGKSSGLAFQYLDPSKVPIIYPARLQFKRMFLCCPSGEPCTIPDKVEV